MQAPHEEAAAIIENKPVVSREVFDQLLPELRARAFTITGIEDADVMQRVRDAIAEVPRGTTWDDARDNIVAELDPWLGDGSERRAELLLRTQGFQSFQAANWRTAQEDDDTTHLQYLTMEDDRVRDSHAALDGIVLPKSDPFWEKHYPPWEWNCRCLTRTMNSDQVDDAKADDDNRAPDDQLVMEGPALRKLREGTLIRNGQAFDVSSPAESDPNAFHWHPDDLTIPLDVLKDRFDPEVFAEFMAYAQRTQVAPGVTLAEWLKGADLK